MTAIAGFWSFGRDDSEARCRAMLDGQAAFGPHGRGEAMLGDVAIGRCSYHLLPEDSFDDGVLFGAAGSLVLAADVRIDNRPELAAALVVTAADAARMSDSALFLAGLERLGSGILDRIVGEYAAAWYDHRRRQLFLARDPLGQRPLFWQRHKDFFAFSSMPSGMHAIDPATRASNAEWCARFAALLPERGADSYHAGLRRIEPGHLLTVTAEGEIARRFWTPPREELRLRRFDDYVDAYREKLDQAVKCRLRGIDGVVASHLSGGWDSGAVTATAARLLGDAGQILAYTSVPQRAEPARRGRFTDEARLAAATAALYPNVLHRSLPNPGRSPIAYLDDNLRFFQRPIYNLCNHGWLAGIREAAREAGARVLLTGEIGNWTISAAPTTLLADFVRQRRWADWGREARAMVAERRARLRGVLASSFGPWLPTSVWRAIAGLSSAAPLDLGLRPEWRERLADGLAERRFGAASRRDTHWERTVAGLSAMDYGQYRKGVLGGWGIDKRDATADLRLVEFALSLPIEMLLNRGQRRPLARAALADRLPAAVLDERRKGYQAADWHVGIANGIADIDRLLDRIDLDPEARELIDAALLRRWLCDFPSRDWERPSVAARYRSSLLFALVAGHFVVSSRREPLPAVGRLS